MKSSDERSASLLTSGGEKKEPASLLGKAAADSSFTGPFVRWFKRRALLGVEPSPELAAILIVYFVQGASGLARLATSFFFKDDLQVSPAEVAALTGLIYLPWFIKPVYGFLSDAVPIAGYRRRSYLALSGVLGAAAWLALANPDLVNTPATALAACILTNLSVAVADVVADSLVVERTRDGPPEATAGSLQSLCWGSSAIGGLLTAYSSGSLLSSLTSRQVFGLTAVFPLLVLLMAFLINEKPVHFVTNNGDSSKGGASPQVRNVAVYEQGKGQGRELTVTEELAEQAKRLWSAVKRKEILLPTLFLFLFRATPSSDSAFFFFLTNDIKLSPEFLGRVRLGTSAGSLVGVWLYNTFLKEVPIKKLLVGTTLASLPIGLSQLLLITHVNRDLGIPDTWLCFGDDVAATVLGQLAFLPTLVLAAQLCPPGVEGTLFATLMSIFNAAAGVGTELGAVLTSAFGVTDSDFTNLGALVTLCNVSSLFPLLFINLLPDGRPQLSNRDGEDTSAKGAEGSSGSDGREAEGGRVNGLAEGREKAMDKVGRD
ncbi:unnamed protein product [Vitrella brassicaformis CCMP3155]|uniref:Major facilitator superfamily (MFS) profile domain-containing protein n=1 Tax=Vitrella brassicaformis (strain CCMP3155) TaxID=1169540 RepID=A0A0G4ETT0_VITBC|nr:unnamed protein product [Vitrella brassicaformis CCMP3155]|eukprot:CEM01664.1 unnamed protein product [Vitrella brassicaformis CCMP3155]